MPLGWLINPLLGRQRNQRCEVGKRDPREEFCEGALRELRIVEGVAGLPMPVGIDVFESHGVLPQVVGGEFFPPENAHVHDPLRGIAGHDFAEGFLGALHGEGRKHVAGKDDLREEDERHEHDGLGGRAHERGDGRADGHADERGGGETRELPLGGAGERLRAKLDADVKQRGLEESGGAPEAEFREQVGVAPEADEALAAVDGQLLDDLLRSIAASKTWPATRGRV
jgi:hypothetical protein